MTLNTFGQDVSKMVEQDSNDTIQNNGSFHAHQQTQSIDVEDVFRSPKYKKTALSLSNEAKYRINPLSYRKLLRGYLRQDWDTINTSQGNEELRAEWIDILFDLIFVACVVHISVEAVYSIPSSYNKAVNYHEYCDSGRYDFVLTCFAQFGILSLFWMEQTMIDTHFVFNQTMDIILEVIYFLFVLSTGLFIENDETFHIAFQLSYMLVRVMSCLYYFKSYLIPRAKLYSIWHLIVNTIVIILLIIISFVFRGCTIDYCMIYFGFFAFEYVSFIIHWCIKNAKGELIFALAIHVSHIAERFGLFVMLILGEAIISIMTSHIGAFNITSIIQIVFTILTFLLCFFIGRLYFDCQPNEHCIMHESNNHALKTSIKMRVLFLILHHILFFGLLGFGIGIKIAFKHFKYEEKELMDIILPVYSVVIIAISLNVIRLTHPNKVNTSNKVWFFRFILIIIMSLIPIFANEVIVFCIILICVICLNMVDVEGKYNREEIKHELKEKRLQMANQQKHEGTQNLKRMDSKARNTITEEIDMETTPNQKPNQNVTNTKTPLLTDNAIDPNIYKFTIQHPALIPETRSNPVEPDELHSPNDKPKLSLFGSHSYR